MSKEPTRPSDSLVQQLLAERRELKVAVERLKIELADASANSSGGPDPRVKEMLEDQLASVRAEATGLREERDSLRAGIKRALDQVAEDEAEEE